MKRIFTFILVVALALGYTSCKDDDDPKDSGQDTPGGTEDGEVIEGSEANEKALKFWAVASQLVGTDSYTTNYADTTFEPTIGTAEGNVRIVMTNDMQTAAKKFAYLTGADIDEQTATYTYEDPEVGRLTYTKVNDGTTLATVDVSIKQIPHLEKIIYRTGSDDNSSFGDQKAWYRFGDVVKKKNKDGQYEYWICVRPAFTYEKKDVSHWVCVSALSKGNTYEYHYDKQNTSYYLPTKLGTDMENMQNFAEMLYAICYPQEWYDNCLNLHTDGWVSYSGVPIFHDFQGKNLKYHNQYFWMNVKAAWESIPEIQQSALNLALTEISSHIKTDGINLLYNGYSWKMTQRDCSLYNASYTIGASNGEKNLHKAAYNTISKKVYTFDVDCRTMGKDIDKYNKFFNDNKYRWVIRHATGKELNNGTQPAATAEIQGVEEVYRYYSRYPGEKARKGDKGDNGPEVTVVEKSDEAKVGYVIANNNKFYKTVYMAESDGAKPLGLVVYVEDDKKHGLAMSLKYVTNVCPWSSDDSKIECDVCSGSKIVKLDDVMLYNSVLTGPSGADSQIQSCTKGHEHTAVKMASTYKAFPGDKTAWFLPSASDIYKIFARLTPTPMYSEGSDNIFFTKESKVLYDYLSDMFDNAGLPKPDIEMARLNYFDEKKDMRQDYSFATWTCSISTDNRPILAYITTPWTTMTGDAYLIIKVWKDDLILSQESRFVRPFMAF